MSNLEFILVSPLGPKTLFFFFGEPPRSLRKEILTFRLDSPNLKYS